MGRAHPDLIALDVKSFRGDSFVIARDAKSCCPFFVVRCHDSKSCVMGAWEIFQSLTRFWGTTCDQRDLKSCRAFALVDCLVGAKGMWSIRRRLMSLKIESIRPCLWVSIPQINWYDSDYVNSLWPSPWYRKRYRNLVRFGFKRPRSSYDCPYWVKSTDTLSVHYRSLEIYKPIHINGFDGV